MTQEGKERKIKILSLLLLVYCEKMRKLSSNGSENIIWEYISTASEIIWTAKELRKINTIPTYKKGSLVYHDNKQRVII